jgi:hypothetical protein
MADLGIMLYGYGEEDATTITGTLGKVLGEDVLLYSASGREADTVGDIIEGEPGGTFEDAEAKVLMVLGFTDAQLEATLKGFPKVEGLSRPIFCVPTENNVTWPLSELVEDLLSERRAFMEMRARSRGEGP